MDVDVISPGSRIRISPRSQTTELCLPIPAKVYQPDFDKLSKDASILEEDLEELRSRIRSMDAPKLSLEVQPTTALVSPPGSQLISSTNPALSTIASSVLNDKVNCIRHELAIETRARIAGDDDMSRRLRSMEHKQNDLELRFRKLELEKDLLKKENGEALKLARQEIGQAKQEMEQATEDAAEQSAKLKEEIEKLQKDASDELKNKIETVRKDLADQLHSKLKDEIDKLHEAQSEAGLKDLQGEEKLKLITEEALKQAQDLLLKQVEAAKSDWETHIQTVRAEMESGMKKELDTFNLKASKDSEEKSRILQDSTLRLEQLVTSFTNDFKAKLETKLEATRLKDEIEGLKASLETQIQEEQQKRQALENETRDQKARLVPIESRMGEVEQQTKAFIQRSGMDIEEERQKAIKERSNLKQEVREMEMKLEEEMKKRVKGLNEKLQPLLNSKAEELKLQEMKKDLLSRSEELETRLRQEIKNNSLDVSDKTEKVKKEFKDRIDELESFVRRLKEQFRQL